MSGIHLRLSILVKLSLTALNIGTQNKHIFTRYNIIRINWGNEGRSGNFSEDPQRFFLGSLEVIVKLIEEVPVFDKFSAS